MNKKFSTLVASMLLATTVGTVSAQNLEFTKSALPTNVRVESVADGKCYQLTDCLLYTSPSPRDAHESRMPSSA